MDDDANFSTILWQACLPFGIRERAGQRGQRRSAFFETIGQGI